MNCLTASGRVSAKIKATDFTDNTDFNICAICEICYAFQNTLYNFILKMSHNSLTEQTKS